MIDAESLFLNPQISTPLTGLEAADDISLAMKGLELLDSAENTEALGENLRPLEMQTDPADSEPSIPEEVKMLLKFFSREEILALIVSSHDHSLRTPEEKRAYRIQRLAERAIALVELDEIRPVIVELRRDVRDQHIADHLLSDFFYACEVQQLSVLLLVYPLIFEHSLD
jgi:hypothetical protein